MQSGYLCGGGTRFVIIFLYYYNYTNFSAKGMCGTVKALSFK